MAYTVQEAANLSGTAVKTLYHYQKVGLHWKDCSKSCFIAHWTFPWSKSKSL